MADNLGVELLNKVETLFGSKWAKWLLLAIIVFGLLGTAGWAYAQLRPAGQDLVQVASGNPEAVRGFATLIVTICSIVALVFACILFAFGLEVRTLRRDLSDLLAEQIEDHAFFRDSYLGIASDMERMHEMWEELARFVPNHDPNGKESAMFLILLGKLHKVAKKQNDEVVSLQQRKADWQRRGLALVPQKADAVSGDGER